jgi:predicted nucleotidyltransferase
MREVNVDLDAVMAAFEYSDTPINHYLDLDSGEVIMVSDAMRNELEAIYEEYWDLDSDDDFDLPAVLNQRNLPKWHRDALLNADAVEEYYLSRYLKIPASTSGDGYRDMQDFIQSLHNEDLKNQLWQAINGRGAFRNFKTVLYKNKSVQAEWYAFEENRLRQRVLDWLDSNEIIPTRSYQPAIQGQLEPVRSKLIEEALNFIRAARKVNGVLRIALIGSLTTDKVNPKDVDILVTITEDADLTALASLARKMSGHAQSFSSGADVFLADIHDEYLGRTCPWRECRTGIRASCDALHCGERQYLHDDLNTIRLSTTLIARPPIELWPETVTRVNVPKDVELGIIAPLKLEG